MVITLGIGEYAVSNRKGQIIKTHALGSCVALIVYCSREQVLAMAHIALPDSTLDPEKAKRQPGYFADTAVASILSTLEKTSCQRGELTVVLCGGADSTRKTDVFKIGKRNLAATEEALRKYRLSCTKSETGGTWSRTVQAEVDTGTVTVYSYPLI